MTNILQTLAKRSPAKHPGPRVRVREKLAVYDDPAARLVPDAVDEGAMTATFCISTQAPDRMGDVMVARGCLDTLDNYARNPRVFFNHQQDPTPIGSARKPDGSLAVEVKSDRVLSTCYFHGKTRLSLEMFTLVAARELEMASIGFLPLEAERMKGSGGDWPDGGFRISKWDLLEWSIVGVPANQEAARLRYDKGIGGRPLCDEIRMALAPHVAPTRAWTNGFNEGKSMEETKAEAGTDVQAVVCPKESFPTADDAKAWCELHDYKADAMTETETAYVFEQFPAAECGPDGCTEGDLADGAKGLFCQRQVEDGTQPVEEEAKGVETPAVETAETITSNDGKAVTSISWAGKAGTDTGSGASFANVLPPKTKYSPAFLGALKSDIDAYREIGEHPPTLEFCDQIEALAHDLTAKHFPGLGVAFKAAPPVVPEVSVEVIAAPVVDARVADLQAAKMAKLYEEVARLRQDFRKARGKVD